MIEVKDMTLTYSSGKGVFNLDFSLDKGGVTGYLGPNGAGKTTTIRALLGFMKPDSGTCLVNGMDTYTHAPEIQVNLGYIPGETAFFSEMTGAQFLDFMMEMRRCKDRKRRDQLLEMFELDLVGRIRKFSKGMKQKLGIVTAFMHDPEVYILDEPTSGLDPLMQTRFIELVHQEKQRGKTILMSSHIFEEVEKTCDNVIIIKSGRIVNKSDVASIKSSQRKGFSLVVKQPEKASDLFASAGFEVKRKTGNNLEVFISGDEVDAFVKIAATLEIQNLDIITQTLEDIFMQYYREGDEAR
ncbi:MAG: ABC transporter ATP-binding protein [Bacilli bacterium]|nr:ABC transporter ATP-binding protein [Bacilli bacterium]MBN2697093.1 ABC transporter ATP-binding protein [Bacilli bacterium]